MSEWKTCLFFLPVACNKLQMAVKICSVTEVWGEGWAPSISFS